MTKIFEEVKKVKDNTIRDENYITIAIKKIKCHYEYKWLELHY